MRAPVSGCCWYPPTKRIHWATCSVVAVTPITVRAAIQVRVLADLETGAADLSGGFLDALAMDTLALLETRWRAVVDTLGRRFAESELGEIAPEELSALPGVQEVLGLHEVGELATAGQWDHIVVDCASTADALRMLTLPATFALYVERAVAEASQTFRRRRCPVDGGGRTSGTHQRKRGTAQRAIEPTGTLVGAHLVLTAERVGGS